MRCHTRWGKLNAQVSVLRDYLENLIPSMELVVRVFVKLNFLLNFGKKIALAPPLDKRKQNLAGLNWDPHDWRQQNKKGKKVSTILIATLV